MTSSRKAEAERVFQMWTGRRRLSPTTTTENISADRCTEGARPVMKAKTQRAATDTTGNRIRVNLPRRRNPRKKLRIR